MSITPNEIINKAVQRTFGISFIASSIIGIAGMFLYYFILIIPQLPLDVRGLLMPVLIMDFVYTLIIGALFMGAGFVLYQKSKIGT